MAFDNDFIFPCRYKPLENDQGTLTSITLDTLITRVTFTAEAVHLVLAHTVQARVAVTLIDIFTCWRTQNTGNNIMTNADWL